MKSQCLKLDGFLCVLWLIVWAAAPWASAQSQLSLGLGLSAGQPTLSLTGQVGRVYSIQYATRLSTTNVWLDLTLLQAQGASTIWTDPVARDQRFYRAVSVPAPALVFIQPGTFTMGSPTNEAGRFPDETQHTVTISRGFWMGKSMVTQGDYLAVVGSNPSTFGNSDTGAENGGTGTITNELVLPVETVSWYDATNYCALRTQRERAGGLIPTNYVYRLPTESEWEYAARAGTTTAFYLGSGLHSGQANFDGQFEYDASVGTINNPSGLFLAVPTPGGRYAANPWGLYDMIGNMGEWCQDWYGAYPAGTAVDPQGPPTGSGRVIRGGYWENDAKHCRLAIRGNGDPSSGGFGVGFRVLLAPGQ